MKDDDLGIYTWQVYSRYSYRYIHMKGAGFPFNIKSIIGIWGRNLGGAFAPTLVDSQVQLQA